MDRAAGLKNQEAIRARTKLTKEDTDVPSLLELGSGSKKKFRKHNVESYLHRIRKSNVVPCVLNVYV